MKILLHTCCAPCAIHPLQDLRRSEENAITLFFYNPNIHPYTEMRKRLEASLDFAESAGVRIEVGDYDMESFFSAVAADMKAPARCLKCWRLRLTETARLAAERGFDAFSSTLLVSPYQNRETILEIGEELMNRYNIRFLPNDWRNGFREAQEISRQRNMYRQKYCGCVFSERDRYMKRKTRDKKNAATE